MHKLTGTALDPLAHIRQSIGDILTTPKGCRCLNRTYGSDLHRWQDAPSSPAIDALRVTAASQALATWEPRIKVQRVRVSSGVQGQTVLTIEATLLANGSPITLEGITLQ